MGYIKTFCQDSFQSSYSDSDSPPVADEDLLAEDGAVGAEEGHGVQGVRGHRVPEAHVISLALLLGVRVVAAEHEAVAGEGGLLDAGQDRVVHTRLPWDRVPQPVQRVITLALNTKTGPETEAHACKEGGQLHHQGVQLTV